MENNKKIKEQICNALEIQVKQEAQESYCKRNSVPVFVPLGSKCHHCKAQIWELIKMEDAKNTLITCCPNCQQSWCE